MNGDRFPDVERAPERSKGERRGGAGGGRLCLGQVERDGPADLR